MSYLNKTVVFGAITAILSSFGFVKVTALSALAASGLFGVILAALIAGAGFTAYYALVDAIVQRGFFGSKAMSAEQAIPVSAVSTIALFLIAPALHLFSAGGLLVGALSLVAYVAADHLTDRAAQTTSK